MDERTCRTCSQRKSANEFSTRETGRLNTECKACVVRRVREWRLANRDRSNTSDREGKRRRRSAPDYRRAELDKENARRRAKSNRGDEKTADCRRCGAAFTYTFIQKHRYICDLCRRHDNEWKKFGLTGAQAVELRSRGACDICGGTRPGGRFNEWHIDHDHVTGVVRGLLCAHCNTSLGLMADSPERLRAAATYLERFPNV